MNSEKRFFIYCGTFLLFTFSIIFTSWATKHSLEGGPRLTVALSRLFVSLANFPSKTKGVLSLISNYYPPDGSPNIYENYRPSNTNANASNDFLLVTLVSSNGTSEVYLNSVKTKSSMKIFSGDLIHHKEQYTDELPCSTDFRKNPFSSRSRIWHSYVSKLGVLTFCLPSNDLISIDLKTGLELWRVKGTFHHSIEPDHLGNLWVCASITPNCNLANNYRFNHSNNHFENQALVQVFFQALLLM